MSGDLLSASLGLLAGLGAASIGGLVADDYKRFRNGSGLAGALAGELSSYAPVWPTLFAELDCWELIGQSDQQATFPFRPFDPPKDKIYEARIADLGLLSPDLVEDIVFTYGNFIGARLALAILAEHGRDMEQAEFVGRVKACRAALQRGVDRAPALITRLRARAAQGAFAAALDALSTKRSK